MRRCPRIPDAKTCKLYSNNIVVRMLLHNLSLLECSRKDDDGQLYFVTSDFPILKEGVLSLLEAVRICRQKLCNLMVAQLYLVRALFILFCWQLFQSSRENVCEIY